MDGVADYVKEGLDLYMTGCLKTQDSSLCFQLALLPSEPYFLLSGQHKDRSILWNPRHYFFFHVHIHVRVFEKSYQQPNEDLAFLHSMLRSEQAHPS